MDSGDVVFFETTRRFAPKKLARDDVRIALELAQVAPGKPIADLGCGYGRHLEALKEHGFPDAIGVDRSAFLLSKAPQGRLIRADLRSLPMPAGSLSAAFCFYSSMFLGTHADAVQAFRETARVLRPGGSFVLTTDNPLRLAANPSYRFEDAGVVEESTFDPRENVDRVTKRLRRPSGEELSATFLIRYYAPPRLAELALEAGLLFRRLEPDAPLTTETPQLIALLEKVP